MTSFPARDDMRFINPCTRAACRFLGWNVLLGITSTVYVNIRLRFIQI